MKEPTIIDEPFIVNSYVANFDVPSVWLTEKGTRVRMYMLNTYDVQEMFRIGLAALLGVRDAIVGSVLKPDTGEYALGLHVYSSVFDLVPEGAIIPKYARGGMSFTMINQEEAFKR